MPGERGLDRGLGRLAIADLADHDDVRVVAEDRAQTRREVSPTWWLTWIWLTPVEVVLDRVLDRDRLHRVR